MESLSGPNPNPGREVLAALAEMLRENNGFVAGVASILGQQNYTKK